MNIKTWLLIGLLCPVAWLHAQTDFKPGFVITLSNDTLYGEIDYRSDLLMGQRCKFKSNETKVVDYSPTEIAAYRFPNSKYYVSKNVNGSYVFLEFLIKGQVNIYYLRDVNGDHYYIDKETEPLTEMPYKEDFMEKDGVMVLNKTKTHIGVLNYYMQDAPGLRSQIDKMQNPEHDNLVKLAEKYHHAVCTSGEQCIVFEKKLPWTKVAMDLTAGAVNYREGGTSITGGVLLNFWLPRSNEKVYFRTGILYSKYEEDAEEVYSPAKFSVYKIPLMFEYIYPKSIIRPKFAYGISVYPKHGGYSVTCMGGLNIQLSDKAGLFLEYDIDFKTNVIIIPGPLLSQGFLGGVSIRF